MPICNHSVNYYFAFLGQSDWIPNIYFNEKSKCPNDPYSSHLQDFFTCIPLNRSSWTFELLHTILQHNDCTSSSFPVTMWPWVNIRVIETAARLQWSVVPSAIPSLKPIGSQISWHRTMWNVYFTKKITLAELCIAGKPSRSQNWNSRPCSKGITGSRTAESTHTGGDTGSLS